MAECWSTVLLLIFTPTASPTAMPKTWPLLIVLFSIVMFL